MKGILNLMKRLVCGFINQINEYGFYFAFKSVLSYIGIRSRSNIKIPNINKTFSVNHHMFWKRLEKGEWEVNCINYLYKIIQEGQTIIDVGAWIGPCTLFFSELVKANGKVIAFDPDPVAFKILKENIKINNLSNVCAEKLLISNNNENVKLLSKSKFGGSGSSIILKPEFKENKIEIIVNSITLDEYCKTHNIVPDGIKIDVEGAEKLVIEGCKEIINKYNPWVILEFHGQLMSENERKQNWNYIIKNSKEIIFIEGRYCKYKFGDKITSMPNCMYFHVFIQY